MSRTCPKDGHGDQQRPSSFLSLFRRSNERRAKRTCSVFPYFPSSLDAKACRLFVESGGLPFGTIIEATARRSCFLLLSEDCSSLFPVVWKAINRQTAGPSCSFLFLFFFSGKQRIRKLFGVVGLLLAQPAPQVRGNSSLVFFSSPFPPVLHQTTARSRIVLFFPLSTFPFPLLSPEVAREPPKRSTFNCGVFGLRRAAPFLFLEVEFLGGIADGTIVFPPFGVCFFSPLPPYRAAADRKSLAASFPPLLGKKAIETVSSFIRHFHFSNFGMHERLGGRSFFSL